LHGTFAKLGAGTAVQSCVEAYRERYLQRCAGETTVVAGIPDVLAALAGLPLLVVTSKPRALAEPLLTALGLRERFAAVVGPELDVEHETKATTVGRALEQLPPDCRPVMVGDRKFDVIGAREHGLPAIGVLWGIGDQDELTQAGAAALVRTRDELLSIVLAAADGGASSRSATG
jgi:phosphoglycolate phosphatase